MIKTDSEKTAAGIDTKQGKGEHAQRNAELLRRAGKGDAAAAEALICENRGLVQSIAVRFLGRGAELEDLFQIGCIGIIKAIRSFDPSRGCVFSTYAVPLISGEIRRFLRDDGMIKVSRSQKKLAAELLHTAERIFAETGHEPGISEIAEAAGLSAEEAAAAISVYSPVTSLSEPCFEDESAPLEAVIPDPEADFPSFDRLALSDALGKLPPLWRRIVLLRYFRDMSQQRTAAALGLSQVKVSREEKKIIEFLRTLMQ